MQLPVTSEIVNSSRICSGPPQPLNTHTTDPNSATTQIPHIDPSAQQNGNALPPSIHWPGLRTQPLAMTYPNSPNAQESSGMMSPPPGLIALQQQLNETDIKVFLYATIMLCDKLTEGVENPDTLVLNYNQTLELNGHSQVKIPKSVIDSSKRMFSSKNTNKAISSVIQTNPSHHYPSQCPSISTFSLPTTPITSTSMSTLFIPTKPKTFLSKPSHSRRPIHPWLTLPSSSTPSI